ncbi:NAD(+) synthase, partial [Bacillus pumilus]
MDPKQEIEKRVGFLKDYLKKTGAKGFVLGISGG